MALKSSLYCLCLALCILQATIGEARPDFGTTQKLHSSSAVSALATEIGVQLPLLEVELDFTPDQLGGLAADYLSFFDSVAEKIIELGTALTSKLATGALSTSGKDALFTDLKMEFKKLSDYHDQLPALWPSSLDGLLARELYESLELAFEAVVGVKDVLKKLYDQLSNPAPSSASSEEEFDTTVLPLLEEALELLLARVTLLVYVFQRAGRNIHEASDFYDSYQEHVSDISGAFAAASANYAEDLTAGKDRIANEFTPVVNAYNLEIQELGDGLVGPITNAQGYQALVTALDKFRTDGPAALNGLGEFALPNSVSAHLSAVGFGIFKVFHEINDHPIGETLAEYLARSDENAELCFHRVEAEACELPLQAPIRVRECLDRERPRLCRLQELASELASLQIADIQDLWENLEPCTRLWHRNQRNRCVRHFTTIYDALGTAHLNKYNDFMGLIVQTLQSSAIRVAICLANVDFYSFGTVVPRLEQDLSSCAGCVGRTCPTMTEPPAET